MDRILTPAAALTTHPATRPTSGNAKPASSPETVGDSFARVLDAEMDAVEGNVTAVQPAPAPVSTPVPQIAALEISPVVTQAPAAGSEDAFAVALANVAPSATAGAADISKAPAVHIAVTDVATVEIAMPSPTNPAPAAQVTQAAQASGVVAMLAAASGATTMEGEAKPSVSAEDATTTEDDSATVAAATGFNISQPATVAPPSVVAGVQAPAPQADSIAPAATPAVPTDASAAAPATPDLADAQPEAAAPQADAEPAAQASAQSGAAKPAAPMAQGQTAAVDAAPKAGPDNAATTPATTQAATQNAAVQAPVDASRAAATPPALQSAPAAAVQVYTRIIERADGRAQRFEVRLDPAELGRVDVRIEIGADRKVHAVLAAHDSAALTDLMRGQRALERALTGAGLDLADNGVRFELAADSGRGNASQQQAQDGNGRSSQPNVWRNFNTVSVPVAPEAAEVVTNTWRPQRLDLVA